jgi:cobyrinic acid a,c-diamide synthase
MTEQEQISQNYDAMLSSVALVNSYVKVCPDFLDPIEHKKAIDRNVRHLELMIQKDYWTTENMAPVVEAISTGKNFLLSA